MSKTSTMNAESPREPLLLSVSQVATLLGVSTRTIWRMESKGDLMEPTIRKGGVVRWQREAIEKWIEQGCPSQSQNGGQI